MRSMSNLAMVRRLIDKHEKYYKSHQGKDIDHLVVINNNFKKAIGDLHDKIKDKNREIEYKNKEIVRLTQVLADLNV